MRPELISRTGNASAGGASPGPAEVLAVNVTAMRTTERACLQRTGLGSVYPALARRHEGRENPGELRGGSAEGGTSAD